MFTLWKIFLIIICMPWKHYRTWIHIQENWN